MKKYILVLVLFCGCSKKEGIVKNPEVYIKTSVTKPEGCTDLGPVTGATIKDSGVGESYQLALKDIRRAAKGLDANYLYLKRVSSDSKFIAGIAYKCKN